MIFHDKRGVPIQAGDLLRAFHFRPANRRLPKQYLYHLVVECPETGFLLAKPVESFAIKVTGGSFWIKNDLIDSEVISGPSSRDEKGSLRLWCERKKKDEHSGKKN